MKKIYPLLLLFFLIVAQNGITQPLDSYEYHGSVKSVTIERVALSDKLRHWFAGPEVQALLVTEQNELQEAVKQETMPGTLYETETLEFNPDGQLQSVVIKRGDQSLKSKTTIQYASGVAVNKKIEGDVQGHYPEVKKSYDEKLRLIEEKMFSKEGDVVLSHQFIYPSTNTVKKINLSKTDDQLDYQIDTLDEQQRIIDTTKYNMEDEQQVKHTYEFDENNNLIEERIINKEGQTTGLFKYQYDNKGNCIAEQFITISGGAEISKEYRYNNYGDPTWYYSYGRKGGRLDREKYRYKYDQHGNWVTKITYQARFDYYDRPIDIPVTAEYRKITYYDS